MHITLEHSQRIIEAYRASGCSPEIDLRELIVEITAATSPLQVEQVLTDFERRCGIEVYHRFSLLRLLEEGKDDEGQRVLTKAPKKGEANLWWLEGYTLSGSMDVIAEFTDANHAVRVYKRLTKQQVKLEDIQ